MATLIETSAIYVAAMRQAEIDTAFTFDVHFAEQGFRVIPVA